VTFPSLALIQTLDLDSDNQMNKFSLLQKLIPKLIGSFGLC